MLQSLHVKNIALIDDVEINFSDGLNILTGETGAGKSILIDSVNFALGEKLPKDIVREDAEYALSELVFSVNDRSTIDALSERGVIAEDGEVILQRRIVNGKSQCRVNGESVPVSLVKDIASYLIDIHGQHEHQSLLYKKNHKIMLDSFCGDEFEQMLSELKKAYDEYSDADKEYREACSSSANRQQELDFAEYIVNEIENAHLNVGEDDRLEADFSRMNNARKIAESLQQVRGAMASDSDGAGSYISYAVSCMKQIVGIDKEAEELYKQLSEAEGIVQDFNRALYDYESGLEFSQEDFAATQERLDEINRLKMKYGQSIPEILKKFEEESEKIERLNDFDAYLQKLECRKQECYVILAEMCKKVSEVRNREAVVLSQDITKALNNLNFLDARFEIVVTSDENKIASDGYDDVEFMLSTNPGESIKPLIQVASGGELSRIMLALKSVLAKRDVIETLIFDEIDTGISGKTAQRVADRMSDISGEHQVICITHLPQIASHAKSHYLISKDVENGHTKTSVIELSYEASVEELARMLAGENITDAVLANAAEMKREANN